MKTQGSVALANLSVSFLVEQSPREVFDAVNNVRGWWSGEIEGPTDALGAEFVYSHQDIHRTTQKITEWVPEKRIVWHVVQSYLGFVDDKHEWDGTDIVFDIERKGNQTELRFTHLGLVPAVACYGKCAEAWDFYITDSLRKLVTTAKGEPNL
jgi:hypothetical protein